LSSEGASAPDPCSGPRGPWDWQPATASRKGRGRRGTRRRKVSSSGLIRMAGRCLARAGASVNLASVTERSCHLRGELMESTGRSIPRSRRSSFAGGSQIAGSRPAEAVRPLRLPRPDLTGGPAGAIHLAPLAGSRRPPGPARAPPGSTISAPIDEDLFVCARRYRSTPAVSGAMTALDGAWKPRRSGGRLYRRAPGWRIRPPRHRASVLADQERSRPRTARPGRRYPTGGGGGDLRAATLGDDASRDPAGGRGSSRCDLLDKPEAPAPGIGGSSLGGGAASGRRRWRAISTLTRISNAWHAGLTPLSTLILPPAGGAGQPMLAAACGSPSRAPEGGKTCPAMRSSRRLRSFEDGGLTRCQPARSGAGADAVAEAVGLIRTNVAQSG
jgi:hypothetical protein